MIPIADLIHRDGVRLFVCIAEPREGDRLERDKWYEVVRRKTGQFHILVGSDGWASFRCPGDIEARQARLRDWVLSAETPDGIDELASFSGEQMKAILERPLPPGSR